jgi:hypothetical protein
VACGLTSLLATATLYGCSGQPADEKAVAGAARLARDNIKRTADLIGTWMRSSADTHVGYGLAKKNLTQQTFMARVTLLQSRYAANAAVFDVAATARGEGDNGFGGGHTEKTIRMCVRLTSHPAEKPPRVEIFNLDCPSGLPKREAGNPVDEIVPWKNE